MTSAGAREERRVVTALFADLVGSTPLGERLDPEEVRLIVGEAVARIVRRVEAYGGTVKDLAGDGVLALFGAPTAHEDDTERAVRTGLAVVEEIDVYGEDVARGWGVEPLRVRIGVASGPVVVGEIGAGSRVEYGATGDAVNVAARLQGHAEPGGVLVADAARRLVEPLFAWGEERTLDLRGRDEPVTASPALGAHEEGAKVRGLEGAQVRLVGRQRELDLVREAVDQVMAGAGAILFVTGEPGIGKCRCRVPR
jgi:class 3 adenylate cyclase